MAAKKARRKDRKAAAANGGAEAGAAAGRVADGESAPGAAAAIGTGSGAPLPADREAEVAFTSSFESPQVAAATMAGTQHATESVQPFTTGGGVAREYAAELRAVDQTAASSSEAAEPGELDACSVPSLAAHAPHQPGDWQESKLQSQLEEDAEFEQLVAQLMLGGSAASPPPLAGLLPAMASTPSEEPSMAQPPAGPTHSAATGSQGRTARARGVEPLLCSLSGVRLLAPRHLHRGGNPFHMHYYTIGTYIGMQMI